MLFGRCSIAIVVAFSLVWSAPSSAVDAARDAIKHWRYDDLELSGPNAKRLLAFNMAFLGYCERSTGVAATDTNAKLERLAANLVDNAPEITKKVVRLGETGQLADSTGAVPLTPLKDIATIKGVDEAKFCRFYNAAMGREADRYLTNCKLDVGKQFYSCPN